jgi:hypothetical protein
MECGISEDGRYRGTAKGIHFEVPSRSRLSPVGGSHVGLGRLAGRWERFDIAGSDPLTEPFRYIFSISPFFTRGPFVLR